MQIFSRTMDRDLVLVSEPSEPKSLLQCKKLKLKKGKEIFFSLWFFYGRFLSINRAKMAPTMKIETIMPATAGTKYASVIDCTGVSVGAGVA